MNEKILVVDDEVNVCLVLSKMLEDECVVLTAGNGEEAIEKVEREDPDLLLLDLKMPGMNGLEVMKKVKKIRPDLPIIILSAVEEIKTVVEALRSGADDYLVKPSSVYEIKMAVQETLNKNKNVCLDLPLAIRMVITELSKKMIAEGIKLEEANKYFEKEFISKYGGISH
ncbi:MAG TPA: hypothetical protein DHV62_02265 [Elusimicrobia bacterium]|jgi:DNA-binding response OmpR family regulator|nr:hypothetical protein [Elusimicrobiota bacterium]